MEEALRRIEALEELYRRASEERDHLLSKVCELEDQIEDLTSQLRPHKKPHSNLTSKEPLRINNANKQTNALEDEPWLFYC